MGKTPRLIIRYQSTMRYAVARKPSIQNQKFTNFANKLVDIISNATQSILNQRTSRLAFSSHVFLILPLSEDEAQGACKLAAAL